MRGLLLRIFVGAAIVVGVVTLLVASVRSFSSVDMPLVGQILVVVGLLMLGGIAITLGGPSHEGFRSGSKFVLVSSGTRSLWDTSRNPALGLSSTVPVVAGIGVILVALGLLFLTVL